MIKVEKFKVYGLEDAVEGMRYPLLSNNQSDSFYDFSDSFDRTRCDDSCYCLGEKDLDLAKRLAKGGSDHAKYRRFIVVYLDLVAPLYWWKQFDTYKVGTVANSTSTMHKIQHKEFELDDFSHEHLDKFCIATLSQTIRALNSNRHNFIQSGEKEYWWNMIQLLPSSYNQLRKIELNYEVLHKMYHSRKNHKLDEWHDFCSWIETLPYSELITG